MVAHYPKDTFGLSASGHGLSFYTDSSHESANVQNAKEIVFSYEIWFDDDFDFVKGGGLPGVYGVTSRDEAVSCSGDRTEGRDDCFSVRPM